VSYFKCLEYLENIKSTNVPSLASLSVDNKKFVTISLDKSSKHQKGSNMWCHYCYKNNHNTADWRAIAKFKQQKKASFEAKAGLGKKSLAFFLKKSMHSKGNWILKRLQIVSRGKKGLNSSSLLKLMNKFNH
jgi:hypothetical protein